MYKQTSWRQPPLAHWSLLNYIVKKMDFELSRDSDAQYRFFLPLCIFCVAIVVNGLMPIIVKLGNCLYRLVSIGYSVTGAAVTVFWANKHLQELAPLNNVSQWILRANAWIF